MKPIKFVKTEIRKPRYDPRPESSKTNNSEWRQGLFVIFEDYQGNRFDWMPKWSEIEELKKKIPETEQINKDLAIENIQKTLVDEDAEEI